jgi:hypothetical protein
MSHSSCREGGEIRGLNVTQKLLPSHLVDGDMRPEVELGIRIDQTLT